MSGREWKPGDVAMVKRGPWWTGRAIRTFNTWVDQSGDKDDSPSLFDVTDARPLVVIDPEDPEALDRLWRLHDTALDAYPLRVVNRRELAFAAALREFADPKPPKPEEPTGLGAVVEVESQFSPGFKRRLVRTHNTREPWLGDSIKQAWDEIPGPITVLSEGVVRVIACAEPLPASAFCCELPDGHTGWHRTGPVRWGGGSEVDDHHVDGGHG